jgi:hypothetical protein
MADPLTVLRDFTVSGRVGTVTINPDGRVYFADQYSFPKVIAWHGIACHGIALHGMAWLGQNPMG